MNYSEALKLFGFTGEFTEENLRKKYLELSKKYHPDMGGSDEMMKAVNTAYDTLKGKPINCDSSYYNTLKEENNSLKEENQKLNDKINIITKTVE